MPSCEKGYNWLLPLPSELSEKSLVSSLLSNSQNGFANCSLIIAADSERASDTGKVAILHLRKSIRKRQVDGLFKLESRKLIGNLDTIKSNLMQEGYSLFRTLPISRSVPISGSALTKQVMKRDSFLKANPPTSAGKNRKCATSQKLAELVGLRTEVLACLQTDAGLELSASIGLPEIAAVLRETIQGLMLDNKICLTHIEDLEDEMRNDESRIEDFKRHIETLKKSHEVTLQTKDDRYKQLHAKYENLRSRFAHIERRENETSLDSHRRLQEWKARSVDAQVSCCSHPCQVPFLTGAMQVAVPSNGQPI